MRSRRSVLLALLLAAVCLTYANSFGDAFHFDDFHTIVDNPAVRSLGNLHRIFTDTTAFSVLPANQTYRPVVTASLALDYALGHGYNVFWFHLSTLIWFLLLIYLLFLLAELIFQRVAPDQPANTLLALGVAAWFGLHPAMAETVNYIIQRGDLYCTLGCIAALYLYARWPSYRRFGLYLLPFAVAMLSKPPAAVFPVLLFLSVLLFESRSDAFAGRFRRAALAILPAVLVAALLLWLQAAMTPKSFTPSILSPANYRLTQPYVWLRYGATLFIPLHLNVDTDLQAFSSWNARAMAGAAFVLLLLFTAALCLRQRQSYPIAFGLLWFACTQLPTSVYPLSEVENDHRMFFSFPGLMIAVLWAVHLAYRRIERRYGLSGRLSQTVAALGLVCLAGYAYGTTRRNAVWRTEATLWADDATKSPHNGRGLMIYGLTLMNTGDDRGALDLFQRAQLYTPNYPTLEINLGIVDGLLAAQGRAALKSEAERHFQRAIALAPEDDTTHAYYGRWLLSQGRLSQAIDQLKVAVRLNRQRSMQRDLLLQAYEQAGDRRAALQLAADSLSVWPGDPAALALIHGDAGSVTPAAAAALINASLAAYRAGAFTDSIAKAQDALKVDPHSAEAWNNIGAGYGALHQWAPAIAAERTALQLNPSLAIAQNNLHWFLASQGNAPAESAAQYVNLSLERNQEGRYEESITAAQHALQLDPRSAEAWNNIAAADEALHRWNPAIQAAQNALEIRPDFPLARNNLAWSLQQQASASKR